MTGSVFLVVVVGSAVAHVDVVGVAGGETGDVPRRSMVGFAGCEVVVSYCDVIAAVADRVLGEDAGQAVPGDP
jgi:hypothetical protein